MPATPPRLRPATLLAVVAALVIDATAASVDRGASVNLLANPSFEESADGQAPDHWQPYHREPPSWRLCDESRSGKRALAVEVRAPRADRKDPGCTFSSTQPITVEPGAQVYFSLWYRAERGTRGTMVMTFKFSLRQPPKQQVRRVNRITIHQVLVRDGNWHEHTVRASAPENTSEVAVAIGFWWPMGRIVVDDARAWTERVSVLPSAAHRFDAGPPGSELFPGFAPLTEDDRWGPERGSGWRGEVQAHDRYGPHFPYRRPEALASDLVYAADASLLIELPEARYGVAVMAGDIGGGWRFPYLGLLTGYSISVAGKPLASVPGIPAERHRGEKYFEHLRRPDWEPGDYAWDKYVAPRFPVYTTVVDHPGGPLDIAFRTCPVNMVVIYAGDGVPRMAGELAELDLLRRSHFPFKPRKQRPAPENPLVPTDTERQQGFLLFARSDLAPVWPKEAPRANEKRTMRGFAARGEFEPLTFVVHALRDLSGVIVSASPLVSAHGDAFPANRIRVQFVRYMDVILGNTYECRPRLIQDLERPLDVRRNSNRQFRLLFDVSPGTPAGTYAGSAVVKVANAPGSSIPVALRVLPIDLPDRVPDRYYQISTWNWHEPLTPPDETKALFEAALQCMKDHGHDTVYFGALPWKPSVTWDGARATEFDMTWYEYVLGLYRKLGFTEGRVTVSGWAFRPPVRRVAPDDQAVRHRITRELVAAHERMRQQKFPEIQAFYSELPSDGLPFERQIVDQRPYLQAGVPTFIQSIHHETAVKWAAKVDFVLYSPYGCIADFDRIVREHGKEWGFSNVGFRVRCKDTLAWWRYLWGWWFWRTPADIMANEHWNAVLANPYNPFDGRAFEHANSAYSAPNGFYPTTYLEWMREGRDDHRYIARLEALIRRAEHQQRVEARELAKDARGFLQRTRDRIPLEAKSYDWDAPIPGWSARDLVLHRWAVAVKIMKLQEALL